MSGPIVVAGASGFVGTRLVDRLLASGADVRCGTRDPSRGSPDRRWVELDVSTGAGLRSALAGADSLVFLVHGMGEHAPNLLEREEQAAKTVLAAATEAGVRRIVYLGAPVPEGPPSDHLRARIRTGEVLRSGSVSTIELRASMIIGAGSESWQMCRDLALRLPIMVIPRWLHTRTQPIGIDDVVDALQTAIRADVSGAFDLPGPEVLSARQILERIAVQAGFRPVMFPVPVLTPRLSSWWLRFVTRADVGVARQLVEGLTSDMIAPDEGFWMVMNRRPTPFDEVVRRALAEEAPLQGRSRVWEGAVKRVGRKP